MKLDHDDKTVQRVFDIELAAQRAGVPAPEIDEFEYRYGLARAAVRSPQAIDETDALAVDQAKTLEAVHRDLAELVNLDVEPSAPDEQADPLEREQQRTLSNAIASVRARRDEPSSRS
jgi:hypothetical protein